MKCRIADCPSGLFDSISLIEKLTEWKKDIPEPINFLYELNYRPVSEDFLRSAANAINKTCNTPEIVCDDPTLSARYYKLASGVYRVALVNEGYSYSNAVVKMPFKISDLKVAGLFPIAKLVPDNDTFSIKVPGKGLTVVDVWEK